MNCGMLDRPDLTGTGCSKPVATAAFYNHFLLIFVGYPARRTCTALHICTAASHLTQHLAPHAASQTCIRPHLTQRLGYSNISQKSPLKNWGLFSCPGKDLCAFCGLYKQFWFCNFVV